MVELGICENDLGGASALEADLNVRLLSRCGEAQAGVGFLRGNLKVHGRKSLARSVADCNVYNAEYIGTLEVNGEISEIALCKGTCTLAGCLIVDLCSSNGAGYAANALHGYRSGCHYV